MTREPSDEAILAARLQRAYPSFAPYFAASKAAELCSIARAQHKHAERSANGADGGYVKLRRRTAHVVGPDGPIMENPDRGAPRGMVREHDAETQERVGERIKRRILKWVASIEEYGNDPVWKHKSPEVETNFIAVELRLPGEAEAVSV